MLLQELVVQVEQAVAEQVVTEEPLIIPAQTLILEET
jgi:hypothetical protein